MRLLAFCMTEVERRYAELLAEKLAGNADVVIRGPAGEAADHLAPRRRLGLQAASLVASLFCRCACSCSSGARNAISHKPTR